MDHFLGRSQLEAFPDQVQVQACHVLSAQAYRHVEDGHLYQEVVHEKQDLALEVACLGQEVA